MHMHNLIEYSDAYQKTSGSFWQYYRNGPALDSKNNIIDFAANKNNSVPFKFKQQITGQTGNGGTKDVEIMVPLKYVSKLCRTLAAVEIREIFLTRHKFTYLVIVSTFDFLALQLSRKWLART